MNGNLRELHRFAEERGWRAEYRGDHKLRFTHPKAIRAITTSGSGSKEELERIKAKIRRVENQSGIREHTKTTGPFSVLEPLKQSFEVPAAENDLGDEPGILVSNLKPRRRRIHNMEAFPTSEGQNRQGESRRVYHVRCCMCPAEDHVKSRSDKDQTPAWQTAMSLRARGWTIDRLRSDDLCPSRTLIMDGKTPEAKLCRQDEAPPAPPMSAAKIPAQQSIPAPRLSLSERITKINTEAHRARELSEEEVVAKRQRHQALWRRIHRAIDKSYIDAATGYAAGESDEKIAKRFGVEVEEVANRREEHFGPDHPDSAQRDIVRELHALKKDLTFFQKNIIDAAANLEGRIASILNKIEAAPNVSKRLIGEMNGENHTLGSDAVN